jgi:protein-arginine kinase activator protein McsA
MKNKVPPKTKTVDSEHRAISARFACTVTSIRNLTLVLKEKKDLLSAVIASGDWESAITLKDEINDLKLRITKEKSASSEVDYLMNTAPILFNYYKSFDGSPAPPSEPVVCNSKSILNFFTTPVVPHSAPAAPVNNQRGSLCDMYMEVVDPSFVRTYPHEDCIMCDFCKSRSKHIVASEGITYCNNCNTVEKALLEVEKPSYKEPPSDVTYYAYRRINHLNEWLNQVQGKEFTDIPQDLIDRILLEMNKNKITNMATLTVTQIRGILRKLKTNKYYEHSSYILYKLSGITPPRLGEELEDKIRMMFAAIEEPYLRHAQPMRKNFLSYSYTIHKLLQILGRTEFIKYFPLLKSREKLHMQEIIWKKICGDLKWEFIKSI